MLPSFVKAPGPGRLTREFAAVELVAFDFDGVFTDNMVYVTQEGVESVRCWRSDGIGLTRLRSVGVHLLILSTEVNPVVTVRAAKLKVPALQGVEEKAEALLARCRELGVSPAATAFVGNDVNDIPAFRAVGVPIAVQDAHSEVLEHTMYRTRLPGGHGAVREVCDLIFHARRALAGGTGAADD